MTTKTTTTPNTKSLEAARLYESSLTLSYYSLASRITVSRVGATVTVQSHHEDALAAARNMAPAIAEIFQYPAVDKRLGRLVVVAPVVVSEHQFAVLDMLARSFYQPTNGAVPARFEDTDAVWSQGFASQTQSVYAGALTGRTISAVCATLAKAGLVESQRDDNDRREDTIRLTQAGFVAWQRRISSIVPLPKVAETPVASLDAAAPAMTATMTVQKLNAPESRTTNWITIADESVLAVLGAMALRLDSIEGSQTSRGTIRVNETLEGVVGLIVPVTFTRKDGKAAQFEVRWFLRDGAFEPYEIEHMR
jgi:DNA-binding MarR family transcriptional regulator